MARCLLSESNMLGCSPRRLVCSGDLLWWTRCDRGRKRKTRDKPVSRIGSTLRNMLAEMDWVRFPVAAFYTNTLTLSVWSSYIVYSGHCSNPKWWDLSIRLPLVLHSRLFLNKQALSSTTML